MRLKRESVKEFKYTIHSSVSLVVLELRPNKFKMRFHILTHISRTIRCIELKVQYLNSLESVQYDSCIIFHTAIANFENNPKTFQKLTNC